ncbi:hypothetical protein KY360_02270 [Candidatus Woesearchaeota archaeon]|nr:hypothetical protein [Candidatus Woesearchaeota archaeon]
MKHLHHKLLNKGWTVEEIKRLSEVSQKAHHAKSPFIKFLDKSVYWFFLMIAILGNLVISIILIPIMLLFTGIPLYSIVAILGIVFGLFLDLIIHDMEHLTPKHHILAGLFIVSLAAITLLYMTMFTLNLIRVTGLEIQQQPLVIGAVYTVALLIPYLSTKIIGLKR